MQHLLLLHGALGAKDQLEPLAELLGDQYIVHTMNLSGHGGEPFPAGGFTIPVFACDVLAYLDKENIDQTNIFGYSMGGYIAMYLARYYPRRVGKLVTLATKFHWDEEVAAREVKMLDPGTILEKIPAFASLLAQRHAPNDWKMVLEKTREMMLGLGKKNELGPGDYECITAPSLLLLGDQDKMINRDETTDVERKLKDGKFRLLKETGHPIEKTNMQLLAGLIKEQVG